MKHTILRVAGAAILVPIVTMSAAFGAATSTSSRSNTQHNTVAPSHPLHVCPVNKFWSPRAGKCLPVSSINYNASKSNTGN